MIHTTLKCVTAILCSLLKKNDNSRRLKKTMYAAVFSLSINTLHAQQPALKPLSIGDTVPQVKIDSIINYAGSSDHLAGFQGDLLLLDFWSTWCSACIRSFPKMDSLKRKYKNLQIVLVNAQSRTTNDNRPKIERTLNTLNQRTGANISLPVIYDNEQLDSLFPVLYVPQVVWIQKNKVIAVTGSDQVTAANIEKALVGDTINVHMKKDQFSFDKNIPLFVNGNGGTGKQMLFRSIVTGYIEGIGGWKGEHVENNKVTGCYFLNQSLLDIVEEAYPDLNIYQANRTIIESTNENFQNTADPSIKYQHSFCYELVIPPGTQKQMISYMKEDVKRYFRVVVKNERRKMKCWVLKKSATYKAPQQKRPPGHFDLEADSRKKYVSNRSVSFVVHALNEYTPVPIIDETNTKDDISLDLPYDLTDIKGLKKAFAKAGFELKEEERETEVTVIADL